MREICRCAVLICLALLLLCPQAQAADVRTGLQGQVLNDIVLTEPMAGAIQTGDLYLRLPQGIYWAQRPDVTVTRGDLTLGPVSWDSADQNLILSVEDTSSAPSTITVSNVLVTALRQLPAGPVEIKIGGPAVNESYGKGMFRAWTVSAFQSGACITPPPDKARAALKFHLDQNAYEINGNTHLAAAAPYREGETIYLPLRALAASLGIKEHSILWEGASGSLTLLKSERVLQAALHKPELLINGMPIKTAATLRVKNGHVLVPLDWLTPMFGADTDYDPASGAVTVIYFE